MSTGGQPVGGWLQGGAPARRCQWNEARDNGSEFPNARLASYMVGTPLLGDFLEEGLNVFDMSCEEFEIGRL